MKKSLLLGIFLLSFACLKAQTYTSGHLTVTVMDSMSHDSTTCSCYFAQWYVITVDSSYVGDTVNIVDTAYGALVGSGPYINSTGVSPWTFTTSITGSSSYNDYVSAPGAYAYFYLDVTKVVSGLDTVKYISTYDSLQINNPCSYSTVSGIQYIDNNGDCTYDSGDVLLDPPNVSITENLVGTMGTIGFTTEWGAVGTGWYEFLMQQSWMANYTLFLPPYYAFIFPTSSCFSGSYTFTTLPQSGVDFPLECSSNVDVQCYALSPTSVRLDRPFFMQPYVSNTGCDSASGELWFVLDSRVIYDSALSIYPADTVRGDTLIWNYTNLTNLVEGAYWNSFLSDIYLTLDSTVAVGDTLCFSGYTNIPAMDVNPLNNSFSFCLPVVYSYDPNLKTVSPQGTGPQGYIPGGHDTLTYSLHFQNTGSSYAENINIIDTLDPHINAASLKILGTSANMIPQWLAPGIVEFSFNEIYLPDSGDNYAASQGAVQFSVALNAGLTPGTQIHNTGYIYFDANPAVVTNTTLNTIDTTTVPTSINQVPAKPAVKVYPNPATDVVYVENLGDGEISIMNISGTVVIQQTVVNNLTTIDVSGLPGGVYILKTVSNANTTTTKFTKY